MTDDRHTHPPRPGGAAREWRTDPADEEYVAPYDTAHRRKKRRSLWERLGMLFQLHPRGPFGT